MKFISYLNPDQVKVHISLFILTIDKDLMNIGKFSKFCHDFGWDLPKHKITEIFNKAIHKNATSSNDIIFKAQF